MVELSLTDRVENLEGLVAKLITALNRVGNLLEDGRGDQLVKEIFDADSY